MVRKDVSLVRVMIRCPLTGRAIPAGLTAEPAAWSARPIGLNRVRCRECTQTHTWNKTDASLARPSAP